jgi:hypothetical protein
VASKEALPALLNESAAEPLQHELLLSLRQATWTLDIPL